jgi:hypothetical protein
MKRRKSDTTETKLDAADDDIFGFMSGRMKVMGDIQSPIGDAKILKTKKRKVSRGKSSRIPKP